MCQTLNVTRAGYYAWRCRPVSAWQSRRVEVTAQIRQVYQHSGGTYGSPRVTVELKELGVSVCENTVAKYMRESELRVTPRRRYIPQTTDSAHGHPIAPNRLDQDFAAAAPDRKWAGDITYIFTDQGWLYLAVIIDLCSRRIVGWSMNDDLKADGVADALRMAVARRKSDPETGLLHHSDRGVQYACGLYRELLEEHGITCSMSRAGNCYDNAVTESFFGTFKTELVHREHYRTRAEARSSIFQWIECWYNRRRRHSSLGYLSPEQFEARYN
jgi:transposase InsO family protein